MNKIREIIKLFDLRPIEFVGWIMTIVAMLYGFYFRATHIHVSEYDQLTTYWLHWLGMVIFALIGFALYYPWLKRSRNR